MAVRGRPGYKVKSLLRARLSVRLDSPGTVKSGRSVGLKIPEPAFQHLPDPGLCSGHGGSLHMQRSLQPPQALGGIIPATCSASGDWGHWVLPRGRVRASLSGAGEEPESPQCGERCCGFPSRSASSLLLFVSFSLLFPSQPSPPFSSPQSLRRQT